MQVWQLNKQIKPKSLNKNFFSGKNLILKFTTKQQYIYISYTHTPVQWPFFRDYPGGWWRGTVVERWSLAGELSLSCARPAADG